MLDVVVQPPTPLGDADPPPEPREFLLTIPGEVPSRLGSMTRPPAHWGDPRIYELRGSYWWCILCWKWADD